MQPLCPRDGLIVETVQFPAGPHRLEGELAYPETGAPLGAAVLAGPHPLLGGNMHNNVVRGLGDGLAEKGLATLRFNYRGIGGSEGPTADVAGHLAQFWQTSHVPEELDFRFDLDGAIAFLRDTLGEAIPLAAIGYSFGCALLPLTQMSGCLSALVLIAPTVGRHDYAPFGALNHPLLVIASEDDFATDADQLRRWFDKLRAPRQLIQRRFDNHFFREHEPWLVETVFRFLETHCR
jgi:alpha/beta superfamily hydrolase